ncbi:MAG TPA: CDP-diacylglycerol--serine O-phosphatidyltransferase [Polyangia bacterium]|jgi:CDP-diacylglycerol--serine O-phosphatidyltransferase
MNLRKTFFILPNLFTLSSVFCGFFAITLCAGSHSIESLYQAAIAICFAFFFDLADGRVARLTRTQSNLGLQLDSLADVVSFGAAPALLVYKWGLTRFGIYGVFIAFLFCGAAALRLARFNVLAMQHDSGKPGKFIVGLPVPAAAAVLISLVVLNHQLGGSFVEVGQLSLALLVIVLSYLMVSRIRFRSFKDLRVSRRSIFGGLSILAFTSVVLLAKMASAIIFVTLMAAYLGLGLMEEIIFYRRRREEERAAKTSGPVVLEAEGGARSDEEVLAELGAYDGEENTAGALETAPPDEPRRLAPKGS